MQHGPLVIADQSALAKNTADVNARGAPANRSFGDGSERQRLDDPAFGDTAAATRVDHARQVGFQCPPANDAPTHGYEMVTRDSRRLVGAAAAGAAVDGGIKSPRASAAGWPGSLPVAGEDALF